MDNFFPLKEYKYLLLTIFLLFTFIPVHSINIQAEDSIIYKKRTFDAEDLIRGERLFFGLVYLDNKSVDCAGCHNTRESDTLNWNPNADEISVKYKDKNASDLSNVLLKPGGQKLSQVHKGFQFTPEDIMMIKAYMDQLVETGLKKDKPVITNLLLFIIASILFIFSIIDLIISKVLRKKWINYIILLSTGIFITNTLVVESISIGRSKDYSPFQPVKFSHAVHAGQNETDCIYCHSSAPYSKTAGFPPENVCMNCHLLVRNGTRSGAWEIAKVIDAYDNMKPIEWIKVYNLPDHVFFSHAQHVSAGGLSCQECHGKVESMNVITQVTDLSMGWCINCHRSKKINIENNNFYSQYKYLTEKIKKGEIDSVTVDMIGGIECMKCHY
ncbi:MAG TPA: cytochrome c3 family protein [Anaerovoracaceae bacterium]|nr:cytochrome c3 family protein [Anaerovoracaceae bacterium]